MKLAVPTEISPGERRVALVPDVVGRFTGAGFEVVVQGDAGLRAGFADNAYEAKGARIASTLEELLSGADLVAKVQAPTPEEIRAFPVGVTLVSFLQPVDKLETIAALLERKVTSFSFDLLPRISRAQGMDALSSQATVSGYRAGLIAAQELPKFFPMFMTAAGTIPPAKVLVLGAGVAGLQAIATARRLGAQVRAYDVRAAAKEEVQSLGATFVELSLESQEGEGGYARAQSEEFIKAQRELIAAHVAQSDAVITTAAIPGRKAPVLVTEPMVQAMAAGSVIVDIAAESGGNCELSKPGAVEIHHGVTVYGAANLPSSMPLHASFLYSRNVANLALLMVSDGELRADFDDEIISGCCVTRNGAVAHPPTAKLMEENGR